MIGLFQENGPCRITNDTTAVTLNPYSWNNVSNMCAQTPPDIGGRPLPSRRMKR